METSEPGTVAPRLFHVTAETADGPRAFSRRFVATADAVLYAIDRYGLPIKVDAQPVTEQQLPELDRAFECRRIEYARRKGAAS